MPLGKHWELGKHMGIDWEHDGNTKIKKIHSHLSPLALPFFN